MTDSARQTSRELMTIGELAQRTGLSIRSIREYEGLGLIYSAGRSPGDYRLFDQSALWCAQVIRNLRSLGLTIKEIERLAGLYLSRPQEPIGPHLAALLERAEHRISERLAELESIRGRIQDSEASMPPRSPATRRPVPSRTIPGADLRGLDSPPGVRP